MFNCSELSTLYRSLLKYDLVSVPVEILELILDMSNKPYSDYFFN